MIRPSGRHVTACIPYFRCKRYIARAVESVLAQTHCDLSVLVINDGDEDAPWRELSRFRDPRLVGFTLRDNRGPFFATEVVLRAIHSPFLLIQDADDWSSPGRVERLLALLEAEGSDLAVSAQPFYKESGGRHKLHSVRWSGAPGLMADPRFTLDRRITPEFRYRAPHHGLFRVASLRRIGGYYAGVPTKYDTLLTNLILMTGRLSHEPAGLYHRLWRGESLTHSAATGVGSLKGKGEVSRMQQIYRSCFASYAALLAGQISSHDLEARIRAACSRYISPSDHWALDEESHRLAETLASRR